MKLFYKTGILLITLAVPVFVFLFLKVFGRNTFSLPVYYEEGVVSTLSQCNFVSGTHTIPDFNATSHRSEIVTQEELEGNITIVDFFFTSCPNICPNMSNQLGRVNDRYKDHPEIKILSFTVDPDYDKVEVLSQYAERYGPSDNWFFLTGDKEEIYKLARCGFILPVEDGDGSPEDFIHSERFILVDGEKRIRGYYDGTDREDVDRLIMEIEILLSEEKS